MSTKIWMVMVLPVVLLATATASADTKPARPGKTFIVDRVVAIVNDAIILDSDLKSRVLPAVEEAAAITDAREKSRRIQKLTGQILEEMINEELIIQAAEAVNLKVDSDQVSAALDDIKKQNNLDDAGLAKALAQEGKTLAQFRQELGRNLLRWRTINEMVRAKINVSDEDVRARYDEMLRRSEAVSAVRLSHILVRLPEKPSEQQLTAARDKVAAAITRVRAGEDFAKVAADTSDDEGTRSSGGELGWFERGTISPEWESVVFAMEKLDLRGPIAGPQGLHIFFVADTKRSDIKPFEELKEQIKGELMRRDMDKKTTEWLESLRKDAYVDIRL
jgi:parvulin-like peptidyl-prolyl isomerase